MFPYVIISIVQGITEFLPVSSSAHLVFLRQLFDIKTNGSDFEVALHAGSLLAVLLFYWRKIFELLRTFFLANTAGRQYVFLLIVSSIPAFVAYCILGDFVERAFSDGFAFGYLLITGIMLFSLKFIRYRVAHQINLYTALVMGLMQALALLPGISRSGATFWGGIVTKAEKKEAIEFSLFMSMIAIGGANLFKINNFASLASDIGIRNLLVAFLFSFFSSYAAVAILVKLVEKDIMWIFGIYCIIAGCAAAFFPGSRLF